MSGLYTILLVVHTLLILFMIGVILVQRSDSDGLSGLGGGGGNVLSGKSAGSVLTRSTAILATLFILSSLLLAVLSGQMTRHSIADQVDGAPLMNQVGADVDGDAGVFDGEPMDIDDGSAEGSGVYTAPAVVEEPIVPKPE